MRAACLLLIAVATSTCYPAAADDRPASIFANPFNQELARQYHYVSTLNGKLDEFDDRADLALTGRLVPPLDPSLETGLTPEVLAAAQLEHKTLIRMMAQGARDGLPMQAAVVQSRFDCWIHTAGIPKLKTLSRLCRTDYETAMNDLEIRQSAMTSEADLLPQDLSVEFAGNQEGLADASKAAIDQRIQAFDGGLTGIVIDLPSNSTEIGLTRIRLAGLKSYLVGRGVSFEKIMIYGPATADGPANPADIHKKTPQKGHQMTKSVHGGPLTIRLRFISA